MPESATQRIAAKLAARKANAATPAAVEPEDEEPQVDDEANDSPNEEPAPKKMTMKEKQAARRLAQEEDEAALASANRKDKPAAKVMTPKVVTSGTKAKPTLGKKAASPAQLAAREKFAAASRARAAAARGEEPDTEAPQPVQTTQQIKEAQSAKRKSDREAAAALHTSRRTPTSKPVKGQETKAQAAARLRREKAEAKPILKVSNKKPAAAKVASKAKPAPASKASSAPKASGETKTKVLAMWAKGATRQEIMEALGLSYPSVFYHTRGVEGTGANARGRIFVQTPFDELGGKLGRGKTEEVSRSEAMRRQYRSGMKVGDIARENEVRYQIAYTAIRSLLSNDDE